MPGATAPTRSWCSGRPDGEAGLPPLLPPRPLHPDRGSGDTDRINTAYAHGPQTLIDTVQDNFGIPIHHYVEIDFVGFESSSTRSAACPSGSTRRSATSRPASTSSSPVRRAQRRAGPGFVRSRYLESRTRTAIGTATPPPTSAASPGSRCSCAERSPRPSTKASPTRSRSTIWCRRASPT